MGFNVILDIKSDKELRSHIHSVIQGEVKKIVEKKLTGMMFAVLTGTKDHPLQKENLEKLVKELIKKELLPLLNKNLDFHAREGIRELLGEALDIKAAQGVLEQYAKNMGTADLEKTLKKVIKESL